jgi:ATP-binding cassette subfamily B (MDR/TAP) protein 1
MTNIRTVCSFGYENIIYNKYSRMMELPFQLAVKNGIVSGFFYGIAQLIMFVVIALVFYVGSLFVQNNGVKIDSMFTAIFAIFFSAMTVGNNSHILPDMG